MALNFMVGIATHGLPPGHAVLDAMWLAAVATEENNGRAGTENHNHGRLGSEMDSNPQGLSIDSSGTGFSELNSNFSPFFKVHGVTRKRSRWDFEQPTGSFEHGRGLFTTSRQQSGPTSEPKAQISFPIIRRVVERQPWRTENPRHRGKVGTSKFSDGLHGRGRGNSQQERKSLRDVTKLAQHRKWVEDARTRLKHKMFSRSTSNTKNSKRKKIEEIMANCDVCFDPEGVSSDDLLTIAAVLGESSLKSADQYVGEVKLMQLERGIPWSDVLERQLVMVKRALRRDAGPDSRAKEVRPEGITVELMETTSTTKSSPYRVVWSYVWATLWMLRATEAAEVCIQDVILKHQPRIISLIIRKSKMDQGAKGVKRTLRCCGQTPCHPLCPWMLGVRSLAEHVGKDARCALFPNRAGTKVTKLHLVKGWMDHIDHEMSGHSARRSGAMFYTRSGLGIQEISMLGRWKSSAVFRYVEAALEEIPLNHTVPNKAEQPQEEASQKPWQPTPAEQPDAETAREPQEGKPEPGEGEPSKREEKKIPALERDADVVKLFKDKKLWAISSRRGKKMAHGVLQASWNLDLDKWATRCGWKFAAKHVKVQLTDKLPHGIQKCAKCRLQAHQQRGEAREGVRLAQLL